ncbi:MAG: hypothetical protein IKB88_06670 [Clostridia bacterium]|nr:hypothetical protein [Clostridia bacterium]
MRKGSYKSNRFPQRFCDYYGASNGLLSDKALCLAADCDGRVYIGTESGLNFLNFSDNGGTFASFACGKVTNAHASGKKVYFSAEKTVYVCEDGIIKELKTFDEEIKGIGGKDIIYVITESVLYRLNGDEFIHHHSTDLRAQGLAVSGENIISFSGRSLCILTGKRKHWMCIFPEHSTMPEFKINCVAFDETLGFIWLGTDKGAYIYDNRCGWYGHKEISCLPEEEIFSIDLTDDGKVILSSDAGLIVINNGAAKYLPATRWVCCEKVNDAIAIGNEIWTASDEGVTRIYEKSMTLEEKAEYCFDLTEKYFIRKDGFVTGLDKIKNNDITTGEPNITDNDGLWTHTYLGSLCYLYAVTKSEKVLEAARRSMYAMVKLTKVTGIKGFTARAIRYEGEDGYGTRVDRAGEEWHTAPDGSCEWLGETSSDEMTGHFFGFSLYYDFCANDEEKELIREVLCDIVDHIIDHNYKLCDIDGLPTTWAMWNPDELNRNSMWLWEKCINSLEMLTFLDVAYHISGDEKYRNEFLRLAVDEHYLINAAQHKKDDARITHIDDNLGFLCTATILRIEKDPSIRKYLLMGMKHHWEYERSEKSPLFNLIYGAFTDEVCDIDSAIKALRDMPMDYTGRIILNSNRRNLVYDTEQERWGEVPQLLFPLDYDEKSCYNYDTNPFETNWGNNSSTCSPSCYLLPYWFGRYYGLIEE